MSRCRTADCQQVMARDCLKQHLRKPTPDETKILQRPECWSQRRDRETNGQQCLGEAGRRLCRNRHLSLQVTEDQLPQPDEAPPMHQKHWQKQGNQCSKTIHPPQKSKLCNTRHVRSTSSGFLRSSRPRRPASSLPGCDDPANCCRSRDRTSPCP